MLHTPYEDTPVTTSWLTDQTCCDTSYNASIKISNFNLLIKLRSFPRKHKTTADSREAAANLLQQTWPTSHHWKMPMEADALWGLSAPVVASRAKLISLQNTCSAGSDRSKPPIGFKLPFKRDLDKCLSGQDQSYHDLLLLESACQEEC